MNIFIYSIFMFLMFFCFIWMSMYLKLMNLGIFFEWLLIEYNSLNIEVILLIDWICCLFISILLLISSMIMLYMIIYMDNNKFINYFLIVMILFVMFMLLMLISQM